MKSRLIVLSVFVLIIGILVSCSKVEKQFNNLTSNQIVTDNKQILTTAIVDDNGVTRYFQIINSQEDNSAPKINLVEIKTDIKGNPLTDTDGRYVTNIHTIIFSTSTIDKLSDNSNNKTIFEAKNETTKERNSKPIDDNDVEFRTTQTTYSSEGKSSSSTVSADNSTTKNTIIKDTSTSSNSSREHTEKGRPEDITDEEGWINKWY